MGTTTCKVKVATALPALFSATHANVPLSSTVAVLRNNSLLRVPREKYAFRFPICTKKVQGSPRFAFARIYSSSHLAQRPSRRGSSV